MPPISVLIKPASSKCNLDCEYCFYRDLASKRTTADCGMMSERVASELIGKAFDFAAGTSVSFAFQGGEPTLRGLDFFKFFTDEAERQNTRGAKVTFSLQTNGVLVDEQFARFFREKGFLIGLSVDGDEEMNGARKDFGGKNAFHSALAALELFEKEGVDYNVLAVVTKKNFKNPERTYGFFRGQGVKYIQLIPCLRGFETVSNIDEYALSPEEYGRFLVEIFKLYRRDYYAGKYVSVRSLDNYVRLARGERAEQCGMNGHCSVQFVVEADGTCFPCDFYCVDKYALGNVERENFVAMATNNVAKSFILESLSVEERCKECRWYKLCMGGCKRYNADADYCAAYKHFFETCAPYLRLE